MKRFVYPMVIFENKNDKEYTVLFPDLDIVTCGSTVEEAYVKGRDYLDTYLDLAVKFESDLPAPSTYEEAEGMNPKRIVLLADSKLDVENVSLSAEEASYKVMINNIIDIEGE